MGIKINRAMCKNCGDIVESKHVHHFASCSCFKNRKNNKGIFVDGGLDYLRRGGNMKNFIDLSEVKKRGRR